MDKKQQKQQGLENPETLNQTWKGQPEKPDTHMRSEGVKASEGPGTSGEPVADEHYDLISVLYHALQACETYATYKDDAGDEEVRGFFEQCIQQNKDVASQAMKLLGARIGGQQVAGIAQKRPGDATVGASRH